VWLPNAGQMSYSACQIGPYVWLPNGDRTSYSACQLEHAHPMCFGDKHAGCYVARSLRDVNAALRRPAGGDAGLGGRRVAHALSRGIAAWRPPPAAAPAAASAVEAAAPADAPAAQPQDAAAAAPAPGCRQGPGAALVRARVSMLGRGSAEEGAAVHVLRGMQGTGRAWQARREGRGAPCRSRCKGPCLARTGESRMCVLGGGGRLSPKAG
jgi:hypothetical protein